MGLGEMCVASKALVSPLPIGVAGEGEEGTSCAAALGADGVVASTLGGECCSCNAFRVMVCD